MAGEVFERAEFEARCARAQALMAEEDLAALLLTTEPEVRYFTGFLTRFWESPTRPWFLILPCEGAPLAVIPAIGAALMGRTWIEEIRTWSAPCPEDEGVSLLARSLAELVPQGGRIGLPDGPESHLRMPLADHARLRQALPDRHFTGDAGIVRRLRLVKSAAEVSLIENACAIAGRAFDRVPEFAAPGRPLEEVFRRFQIAALEEGADWVPYLAGGAGQGGYADVISPARAQPLARGDLLMLDTGLVHRGYFSDFDRNWSLGPPAPEVAAAHALLVEASDAAFARARPGATAAELHGAMAEVLARAGGETEAGRLGHGLGMSLTEWPSLIPEDETVLAPGMVLTLEPGTPSGAGIMVHEEVILITESGARYLSPRQGPEVRRL
jgi:Xaa-Pro aminopeptidase